MTKPYNLPPGCLMADVDPYPDDLPETPDPSEDYYRDYASTVAGALHMAYDRWEEACREHDASSLDLDRMLWSGRAQAYSAVVRLLAGCPAGKLRQDPELRLELFQVVKGTPTDAQEAK